jgi:hypothetical protein
MTCGYFLVAYGEENIIATPSVTRWMDAWGGGVSSGPGQTSYGAALATMGKE